MTISQGYGTSTVLAVIIIIVFLLLFFIAWSGIERGRKLNLRFLPPIKKIRGMVAQSVETGKTVHFSPGTGGLNGQKGTAEALNGITTFAAVAQLSARSKSYMFATGNDALVTLLENDTAQAEYNQAGRSEDYNPTNVQLVTQQDNLPYIAGVAGLLKNENAGANIMIGRFGAEYMLAGDVADKNNIDQVVGSTQAEAIPLMLLSAGHQNTLIGEEVYAAPAYLQGEAAQTAALQAQDIIRVLLIIAIIAGIIAATLGFDIAGNLFLR
jgi:hypothetical protein